MTNLFTSEQSEVDNLIAGPYPKEVEEVVIADGEGELPRGAVLGKVTEGGEYRLVNSENVDGSQAGVRVLCAAVDATDEAVTSTAYRTCDVNQNALTFGGTDTFEDHKASLEALHIFLHDSVQA